MLFGTRVSYRKQIGEIAEGLLCLQKETLAFSELPEYNFNPSL